MRIAGGKVKGVRISPPAIRGARPTTELMREVIFNVLGKDRISGARILDLFAGTGSLGIEGLSRGAEQADFVEANGKQCAVIQTNLRLCGFEENGKVYRMKAEQSLKVLTGRYGVVVMDPPYRLEEVGVIVEKLSASNLVGDDGIVAVGHSKRQMLTESYGALTRIKSSRHGDSMVDFYIKGVSR
jgi:16S rRNA (guanine(966)-N(2))-methyltransferase RsmD